MFCTDKVADLRDKWYGKKDKIKKELNMNQDKQNLRNMLISQKKRKIINKKKIWVLL